MVKVSLALALALTALSGAQALGSTNCPADPFADPANDQCNPLRYIPSKIPNYVATALYGITFLALMYQLIRRKGWWFVVLPIGVFFETAGLGMRLYLRNNPDALGPYIGMNTLVVLSPCTFLAANYILLGRIVAYLDAERYLFVRPSRVSWFFVCSDIATFLVQAAGGGLSASGSSSSAKIGSWVFFAGLLAQLLSFLFFSIMAAVFFYRVYRHENHSRTGLWNRTGWKPIFFALGWASFCFLIRSFYRVVELGQGYVGYLATHEVYFLTLDSLPLFLGVAIYTYFWPTKYLIPGKSILDDNTTVAQTPYSVEGYQNGLEMNPTKSYNITSSPTPLLREDP